ncbi:hypothetical protein RB812 [Rhodopirellula baltica SH 1]|uniref:Uncharacterized protein n=1 Tax=Rhodopirellula baltica (strain DSM 10527 / NCIMB 13988 / SH1) TaxID=243090 RepID=Q7UY86_RHOBA|nr:hypothetical protein RB812 [Rhodopirellula baltica SH 1]
MVLRRSRASEPSGQMSPHRSPRCFASLLALLPCRRSRQRSIAFSFLTFKFSSSVSRTACLIVIAATNHSPCF